MFGINISCQIAKKEHVWNQYKVWKWLLQNSTTAECIIGYRMTVTIVECIAGSLYILQTP